MGFADTAPTADLPQMLLQPIAGHLMVSVSVRQSHEHDGALECPVDAMSSDVDLRRPTTSIPMLHWGQHHARRA
jgi:hypothetical protein